MWGKFGWETILQIEEKMKSVEKATSAGMQLCFYVLFMPCVCLSL